MGWLQNLLTLFKNFDIFKEFVNELNVQIRLTCSNSPYILISLFLTLSLFLYLSRFLSQHSIYHFSGFLHISLELSSTLFRILIHSFCKSCRSIIRWNGHFHLKVCFQNPTYFRLLQYKVLTKFKYRDESIANSSLLWVISFVTKTTQTKHLKKQIIFK